MKKILLGTVGLLALGLSVPASAADLAARPYTKAPPMVAAAYDWSGFYIGGNGGYGSSRNCYTLNAIAPATTPVGPFDQGCHDANGAVAGGQIGYRWQTGTFVFGLEAQGDWSDIRGRNTVINPAFAAGTFNDTNIRSFGLFTGQIGYAWNNALLYVKGGAALTDNRYRGLNAALVEFDRASETRLGGVVGAGIEFGFAPNWSVAFEYDHLFMGNRNINFTTTAAGVYDRTDNIRQDADIGTVRLNYRWGGPVVARY